MINWDKTIKKIGVKPIFITMAIALIIIISFYILIICKFVKKNNFANSVIEIVEKNEEPVFAIDKIYLCSSANAIDKSVEQNLESLDVYQYTDIAIYINNKMSSDELTAKNTIKQLYIDNINIETNSEIGKQSLQYTNLLKTGSPDIENLSSEDSKIEFNIVNNNQENKEADYNNPTFYADCSNPITLKYLNNNIYNDFSIEKGSSTSFDGSILQKLGIEIEQIKCKLIFKVNIVNNEDEYFSCWMNFNIPLDDIYEGVTIKSAQTSGKKYIFFLENS